MSNAKRSSDENSKWFKILVVIETILGIVWLALKIWPNVAGVLP